MEKLRSVSVIPAAHPARGVVVVRAGTDDRVSFELWGKKRSLVALPKANWRCACRAS